MLIRFRHRQAVFFLDRIRFARLLLWATAPTGAVVSISALAEMTMEFMVREPERADMFRTVGFEMLWAGITRPSFLSIDADPCMLASRKTNPVTRHSP